MATYNGEDGYSNDGDVFQELGTREIERYFKHKLKSYFTTDHKQTQNQIPQKENKFDIEKELLDFISDFQNFKRTQDDKSVTSDDVDEDEDDDDDDQSESEEEDDDSCEEANEDDASVVVEGSVSGFSLKDLDLMEALTDSRQRGERINLEKQLSLMDLDEDGLNRQLKPPPPPSQSQSNDFLLSFRDEMNKLGKENKSVEKEKKEKEKDKKMCYICGGEIKHIGNYKTSLEAHQKEPFHILKIKEKKSSARSECSSVIGEAALPEFIFVNGNNHFCCKICKGRPIGLYRDKLLAHLQSEEHRMNLQTRFDDSEIKKDDPKIKKGLQTRFDDSKIRKDDPKIKKDLQTRFDDSKIKKDDPRIKKDLQTRFDDSKIKKDDPRARKPAKEQKEEKKEPKNDKLAYAIGFACIKPVNENQLLCTMCDKYIPVAKEMSTLMKNLSHHIESKFHISKMEGMQESLKTIKENPSVQEAKRKLNDNVYKFICLPCNFDGYGYQFCKSHLKNAEHTSRIKILLEARVPVNFNHGVKCVGCMKCIYGAKVNIDEHCVKCIKENGNNDPRKRPRRNRSKPRRQNNRNDGNRDNNQRRNPRQNQGQNQGNKGRRPHNPNRPNRNVAKVDHEMDTSRNSRPPPTTNSSIADGFVMLDRPRKTKKEKEVCVIS